MEKHYTSLAIGVFFFSFLASITFLPQFALIIFVSLILSLILTPFVDKITYKMPRSLASFSILVCFVALLGIAFLIASATIVPMGEDFIQHLPKMAHSFLTLPWVVDLPIFGEELNSIWGKLTNVSVEMMSSSLTLIVSVFSRAIDIALTLLVTYYFIADGAQIQHWLASLFPSGDYHRVHCLMTAILGELRTYILSQLSICGLMGFFVYFYFAYRGLPYGPVFAMLSGISEFIPVVGPTVASVFASAVMVTISPLIGFQTALFFLLIIQLNHNVIYPNLIGSALRLHPVAIILGLAFAGELLGTLGMFLAVPMMVAGRLVITDIHHSLQPKGKVYECSRSSQAKSV